MKLLSLRIITEDIKRLVEFFEKATCLTAQWCTEDFAELVTSSCTITYWKHRYFSFVWWKYCSTIQ